MSFFHVFIVTILLVIFLVTGIDCARAADAILKIGVMNAQAGRSSASSGKGAILAAEMAVADVGGMVAGRTIVLVNADHQDKVDTAKTIAQRWFDEEGVDVIAGVSNSDVALAVQEIARTRKKTLLITNASTTDLTGTACSPYSIHWVEDTYSIAQGTTNAVLKSGAKDWYFIAADYAFGRSMQDETTLVIEANGGTVVGGIKHPLGLLDFSTVLLRAQSSNAKAIALASAGADTVQAMRQASEFALDENGQTLVGLLVYITDIDEVTPELAKGLFVSEGFYWDQNEPARQFSKRFFAKQKAMPSKSQASTYAALRHYFKAIEETKSIDALLVNKKMRDMPGDFFGRPAKILSNGRVIYDRTLYQVKNPSDVRYPWDYYKAISTIPAEMTFKAAKDSGCRL